MSESTPRVLTSATTSTSDYPDFEKFSADAQAQINLTNERQPLWAEANRVAAEAQP